MGRGRLCRAITNTRRKFRGEGVEKMKNLDLLLTNYKKATPRGGVHNGGNSYSSN
jgi:hypothetical protein